MATVGLNRRDRTIAALVAAGLVASLLWALVLGLAVAPRAVTDTALKLFGVAPPPSPPAEVVPPPRPSYRPSGRAAPPNLRSRAAPIAAPVPEVVTPVPPPPVATAPKPFEGAEATQGAADLAGPGTGAGGEGDGTGAGGWGDGDGAGDTPPRRIAGRLRDSDYPREAVDERASGRVGVRYMVDIDGRVPRCQVTRSSGSPALDATTCRLIMQRYRFRPGYDARGRPFVSTIVENAIWIMEDEEEE
mgnify:CR=1 FL=1